MNSKIVLKQEKRENLLSTESVQRISSFLLYLDHWATQHCWYDDDDDDKDDYDDNHDDDDGSWPERVYMQNMDYYDGYVYDYYVGCDYHLKGYTEHG